MHFWNCATDPSRIKKCGGIHRREYRENCAYVQLQAMRCTVTFDNLVVAGAFKLQTCGTKKEKERIYRQNEWRKRDGSKGEQRVGGE